jgi:hypothetical protein
MMDRGSNKNQPLCFYCRHFYITWDRDFPYGCKAMGFKSRWHPSVAVFSSSGISCLRFERKESQKQKRRGGPEN